jgi:esterase/lipase superfamily enzyme
MGKIADILQARGQLDEALKIRNEEQLPVYERLGDVRERAVTMGQIADILQARGQLDEALKIRNEEQLPVYERLGDVRERAVTMGQIADILQARGQLDEALAIHSDRLPVAEAMGDIDSVAHVKFSCASIRLQRGGWENGEAEAIIAELAESFSIAQRTQRVDAIAGIGAQFGQVLVMAGMRDDGLAVLETAAAGFVTLKQTESARQLRDLQETIRSMPAENVGETAQEAEITEASPSSRVPLPFDPAIVPPPAPPPPPMRSISEPAEKPAAATSPQPQVDKAEYVVWYGTNRRPNDSSNSNKGYSAVRDNVVHYGSCRVFIPQSHKIGSIGSPWWKRLITLTDDRLRLLSVNEFEQSAYWTGIAAQLAAIDADERCALVFVHGYNVSFQDAALRAAQIGFDLSVKGAMAFFGWPSQGSTSGYPADEATIEASEGVIADFMTDFADRSGAAAVHIIAHSMGNRGVLRAVNRIATKAQQRTGRPFGQIILAAADVDADVFRQLSAAYADVASRTTLYVSKRDLAVEASRWLHNFPRAGLMPPTLVLPGIDTINVTNVDLTMLGHGYVADARDVLIDMHALITQGAPPDKRFGLREAKNEEGERYWLIGA